MLIYFNFKKDFIYILLFLILNIILNYINEKFYVYYKSHYRFIFHFSELCLIIFYFLEEYLLNERNNRIEIERYFRIKKTNQNGKNNSLTVILLTISSILFYDIYNFDFIILKYNTKIIEVYTLIILFLIIIELLFVYSHHILVIIVIVIFIIYYLIQK